MSNSEMPISVNLVVYNRPKLHPKCKPLAACLPACLPLSPILSLTMSIHPLNPTPNIPPRLLRSILSHIPPQLLHFAFFGFDARDADAFGHLAAYGFGLAGGAHGWVGFVGWWGAGDFVGGEELGEGCGGWLG